MKNELQALRARIEVLEERNRQLEEMFFIVNGKLLAELGECRRETLELIKGGRR